MRICKPTIILAGALVSLSLATVAGAAEEVATSPSCSSLESPALVGVDDVIGPQEPANETSGLSCTPDAAVLASPVEVPIGDLLDRAAICRLIPECSKNADCDAQCGGAGLGFCAHSRCPVRVCRCR